MYGKMGRRMSAGMQEYQIGRVLADAGIETEKFDIHAHVDRSLHLDENIRNIRAMHGISTRNRGMEEIHQKRDERTREHARRQNPDRQTGSIQTEAGREMDKLLMAHRPGKRKAADGSIYYERRENRSDVNPRERL